MQEKKKQIHVGCKQRSSLFCLGSFMNFVTSGIGLPVRSWLCKSLKVKENYLGSKKYQWIFGAAIGSPFLQDTAGTLSNMEGTKCHLLLLLDLFPLLEGVYLGCLRIWIFFSCSGCIPFQSKLNHPSSCKKCECMLYLMAS